MFAALILHMACVFPPEDFEIVYETWCDDTRYEVVDCVYDGDTFYLGGCGGDAEEDFRMLGIQAPELTVEEPSDDAESEAECYGEEAAALLDELLVGERVRMEFDVECEGVFGRTLAWVFLEDPSASTINTIEQVNGFSDEQGTDLDSSDDEELSADSDEILINEVMIRAGYATLYESDVASNIRYTDRLEEAEEEASELSRGLWGACD